MAEFPALPTFTDALIADTAHLSNDEFGAYYRLLMFAWRTNECALPDDDARIARMLGITKSRWLTKLRPVIGQFWNIENGEWRQKRLTKERIFVEKSREQKRNAGKRSAEARALKNKETEPTAVSATVPTAVPTARQQPTPTPTPIKKKKEEAGSFPDPPPSLDKIPIRMMEGWNTLAEQTGLPKAEKLTRGRRTKARQRWGDAGGEAGWESALAKIRGSPFLLGENPRGWRANFDFVLQESSFVKLMEGAYSGGNGQVDWSDMDDPQ